MKCKQHRWVWNKCIGDVKGMYLGMQGWKRIEFKCAICGKCKIKRVI